MFDKSKPKKIVAVDWEDDSLRVVHASLSKRGVSIDKLLAVTIPGDVDITNPEQLGRLIQQTLRQEGIATRHAMVDIPRDQAILKALQLPTTNPNELPGMVEIQLSKELPFPSNEAVIDFAVPDAQGSSGSGDVSVAAVRRDVLRRYEATLVAAGLKPDRVGLRPYGVKVAADAMLRHGRPDCVLFIDVRPSFMEIDVLRGGSLAFSRSASVSLPDGGDAPSTLSINQPTGLDGGAVVDLGGAGSSGYDTTSSLDSLVVEVTRSIEAYRATDPGATIDHVVIGGDVGVEEALSEAIHKRLNITAELYNPAATFGWEPDEGAAASGFAALLGLVLSHAEAESLHFDFLHPKKSVSAAQKRLKLAPIAASIVILFVAAGGVVVASATRADRVRLAKLKSEIKELKGNVRDNKKFLGVVKEVRTFEQEQHVWVDVWYELQSVLPSNKEIVLDRFEVNQKDGRVTLKTRSKNRDTVNKLVVALSTYRREGRDRPRFAVRQGSQAVKRGDKYPYHEELRVTILNDQGKGKAGG